jgi:hypothetical protein
MVGELLAAFAIFMEFCVETEAVSSEEAAELGDRCRKALVDSADRQAVHQAQADPVERYFSLLQAVLSSGRAHIADVTGGAPVEPHDPKAWGWRRRDDDGWDEQGKCCGWLDGEDLLLDPEAAFAEVNRLAVEQGDSLPVTQTTLTKRLAERHMLASTEPSQRRHTVRRVIGAVRRSVLHLHASILRESVLSVPCVPSPEKSSGIPESNGTKTCNANPGAGDLRSTESFHDSPVIPVENQGNGTNGTYGTKIRANNTPLAAATDSEQGYISIKWRDQDPCPF